MPRKIELEEDTITLTDEVDGFLERTVKPVGNSGKVNVPKRFIGRTAYVVITTPDDQSGEETQDN